MLRVVVATLVFLRKRDWLFALFCLVVLCALAAGVKLGMVGSSRTFLLGLGKNEDRYEIS